MLKITKNQGSIQVTADKSGFYPFDGTITFPTNSLFTATSANTDMITFKSTSNGDVQFVGNYKDITISGRSYDTKQKFLTAFSNLANQGSVDAYTKAETDAKFVDKLTVLTNAKGSLFINSPSNDEVDYSVALNGSSVNGNGDVAIGLARTLDKKGYLNLAILNNAEADGVQNIVIGDNRKCKGLNNIGIGSGGEDYLNSDVNGQGNVCIGASSQAHTASNTAVNNSIAIGPVARAGAYFCTVIGNSAEAKSSHAVAVGDSAYVEHDCDSSVAVGNSARAYGKGSVAIGTVSYADNDKPLDICCGQRTDGTPLNVIQSDANGKISLLKGDGTDTRMVIQDEIEALKNAGGGGSANPLVNVKGTGSATIPDNVTDAIAIGSDATAEKIYCISVGYGSRTNDSSVAIGSRSRGFGSSSVAIGSSTGAVNGGVGVGAVASASGDHSVAIGNRASASDSNCVAIGYWPTATTNMPLVINAGSRANGSALPMIQGDANGKISLLKGDGTLERMVIQDEIEALKNAGGSGGTVDAYTKAETDTKLDAKQDKLTAGSGITITKDETTGTNTIATAVSLTDNGNGAYQVGSSIKMGSDTVTIGRSAASRSEWSIAIGKGATSGSGGSNIAIGNVANSSGGTSIAIGKNTETSNSNAIAIGTLAGAYIPKSIAIGYNAKTSTNIPMVINAGGKTMIQGDTTGKISILLGDGTDTRMVISDEITALKAEITTLKAEIAALKGGASTGA